ncbi:putative methyltransferase NSUN6 [Hypsibius exemplaris]|uniref:Methyltransferase NSUN6 n=1 Tax=Hypsibius exemplaris TaxID=2072580 RepID=A0A1W0X1X7_HYPEX|nr:putative methyltransferase NSUN6 [Hypsibius exemplaris]
MATNLHLPSTLTSHADVLEIFDVEYCQPVGCSLDTFLDSLRTPPLSTVLRYNHSEIDDSIPLEEQERIIREGLQTVNKERLLGRSLKINQVAGLSDVWTCEVEDSGSDVYPVEDDEEKPMNVIVDTAAGEALLRGSNLFASGILACIGNMRAGQRVSVYCDVEKKCLKGRVANFLGELYFVGSGIAQVHRTDLYTHQPINGIGILMDRPRFNLLSLSEFLTSHPSFSSPNLPSCVAVQVLGPQPQETILDCCAAPGGKTLHIASLMRNTGRIIAVEKSSERAEKLRRATAHCRNVNVVCADVSKLRDNTKADLPTSFDRILVDAPCSASGQRPRLSFRSLQVNQLESCPKVQKKILHSIVPLLKSGGGRLVYSTCSVLRRENEDVVAWLLRQHPELRLCQQTPHFGGVGFPVSGLTSQQSGLLQRFSMLPGVDGDSIGFFVALFEKVCQRSLRVVGWATDKLFALSGPPTGVQGPSRPSLKIPLIIRADAVTDTLGPRLRDRTDI